ncbi:MAG: hypothetical protein COW66_09735 [Flavobacteriaceae bacterium CG18_big_fil_WC_8_21_14_2_50_34_36]|nr:MAG: hypothetical protein COW66_09735 [Flavobacteriaceae bacterium CG18_big_fil_WC_8_21_14_2_50_34_36]PIV50219.1 MAG: hypothetical protein COS19_04705 [Flavobacteriaceae bacterium CG02_land_8_20_14_3_00_34_13]PIZ08379.1 MAG: hypothetical protein COY56_04210 [Flavobacteriaceae bacterium CG_4_10_14_0_8_um_filter_34_31]PJC08270.1 MAG: hypothetical protein CO068_01855 [Flavobacteriaceae bacterium CG_4_9_14_0_8_um_filter_34_30]
MLYVSELTLDTVTIFSKNFESTEFENCKFLNCDFHSSIMMACIFKNSRFINCKFSQSKFLDSDLTDCLFESCTILGLEWADIIAQNVHFKSCPEMLDLSLRGFGKREINFSECYLHHLDVEPIEKHSLEANAEVEVINFYDCIIKESSFDRVNLSKSKFIDCNLSLIQFSACEFGVNTFLSSNETPGNEFNMIDIRTILNSPPIDRTVLETIFGINSFDIKEYLIDLTTEIQFQSIFISYSFADKKFAKSINEILQRRGIVTFLWELDSPGGKPLKDIMVNNIKEKDRILFIASKDSIKSKACQFELTQGRKKQEISWEEVLFPIHIDNYLFEITKERIRPIEVQEEYWQNIEELKRLNSLDFSEFIISKNREEHSFEKLIHRLIKGLRK